MFVVVVVLLKRFALETVMTEIVLRAVLNLCRNKFVSLLRYNIIQTTLSGVHKFPFSGSQ